MGDTKVKRYEEENHKIYYTYNRVLRKTKTARERQYSETTTENFSELMNTGNP